MKTKIYVLDTNILLQSPNAIFGFADNEVVLTGTTLQELDSKKELHDETGYNARESCRLIEALRSKGDFIKGIPLENGGLFRIEPDGINEGNLPDGFSIKRADNRIISATLSIGARTKSKPVILVSNDTAMRVNASVCGVKVESYRNDHVSTDEVYTGRVSISTQKSNIDQMYQNGKISLEDCKDKRLLAQMQDLVENEFVTLKYGKQSALAVYQEGELKLIREGKHAFGIAPKNAAQQFALYALLAPCTEIPFVILKGAAGTAKTFLSLAAGLEGTYDSHVERQYDKVLISRNNVTADDDFGYLPGDLDEKMNPLLAPFFDNLESLLRGKHGEREDNHQIQMQIEDMFMTKTIDVCPLAYMRGRSITNSYLIVDEAQNATRSQIRDIITRAGKGTKIVICGDPDQIDNHTLDKWNNGLVFAADKMKGSKLCAQLTFSEEESVRSDLATEAIKRLIL